MHFPFCLIGIQALMFPKLHYNTFKDFTKSNFLEFLLLLTSNPTESLLSPLSCPDSFPIVT